MLISAYTPLLRSTDWSDGLLDPNPGRMFVIHLEELEDAHKPRIQTRIARVSFYCRGKFRGKFRFAGNPARALVSDEKGTKAREEKEKNE